MSLENLLTITQYAEHRKKRNLPGQSYQAVSNALQAGRIPFVMVGKSKMIDPGKADPAWSLFTDDRRYNSTSLRDPVPPAPPPASTRETVQAQAWDLCFENASIAAAVLVHELELPPEKALRAAVAAVSTLCLCLAEATDNQAYQGSEVPPWAVPLMDGDLGHEAVKRALADVAVFAVELYRPEDEPPPDNLPSIADMNREMAALGIP